MSASPSISLIMVLPLYVVLVFSGFVYKRERDRELAMVDEKDGLSVWIAVQGALYACLSYAVIFLNFFFLFFFLLNYPAVRGTC